VLALAPTGAPSLSMRELLERLRDRYLVDLVVVSDNPRCARSGAPGCPSGPPSRTG
jgi:hypothetical protein